MKQTLIVIDVQRDFYHPTGTLYVPGGEKVVKNIATYILNNRSKLEQVIFTMDWHPYDDKAYEEPDHNWPLHCAQNSEGAGVANELIRACYITNLPMQFFYKGQTAPHTEYGAFENISTYCWDNGDIDVLVNNRLENQPIHINSLENVVICGIAGDFCVKHTIDNLLKYKQRTFLPVNIKVFLDGVCSVAGNNLELVDYCQKNSVQLI